MAEIWADISKVYKEVTENQNTQTEMNDVFKRWHKYGPELFLTTSEEETPPDLIFEQPEPTPTPLQDKISAAIK